MARFGSSSRSSQRANSNPNDDEIVSSSEPISGFAASAAAGGVAASMNTNMMPPTSTQQQQHRRQQSGRTNTTTASSTTQSRSKSGSSRITSGISTLFRRQPSPDFFNDSNSGSGGSGSGFGRNNVPTPNRDPPSGGSGSMRRSRSKQQQPVLQQQQQQQYSATQRQLLSGSPAVDIPLHTSSTLSGTSATAANNNNYNKSEVEMSTANTNTHQAEDGALFDFDGISTSFNNDDNNDNDEYYSQDDYDDSYDDRRARSSSRDNKQQRGRGNNNNNKNNSKSSSRGRRNNSDPHNMKHPKRRHNSEKLKLPRRYRGFSTSISSLFLDESIVCGAISCCGLLLSSRTEHLLNERNVKRGLTRRGVGGTVGRGKEGGKRNPSKILGVAYIVTIVCILTTYAIWGFDSQSSGAGVEEWDNGYYDDDDGGYNYDGGNNNIDDQLQQQYDQYNNDDDGANNQQQQGDDYNYNNRKLVKISSFQSSSLSFPPKNDENESSSSSSERQHRFIGVMKMRDYKEYIFDPTINFASTAYINLMHQFDADEYYYTEPEASIDHQLQLDDEVPQQEHRLLEDYGNGSSSSSSSNYADQGAQARTVLVVLFLFLLGVIGRRRRMRTRFSILRSRAQDDHLYYASIITRNGAGASGSLATPDNTVMENFHEREDKYDGACSHTLFGCYPVDSLVADYDPDWNGIGACGGGDDTDTMMGDDNATLSTSGTSASVRRRRRKGGDFMSRTITLILNCCCGTVCKCWCQLFSICALAQEAREARLLLPPSMQRIDLITHQPFHEYAKDVNNVRRRFMERANRTWVQHWSALSHLSRYILLGFVLITAFVIMTMLVHPIGGFGWGDALVLIATFSQSFVVLFIVFGIFHRSDLSFDAVVKFFAVGFCICVPVGFVLEGVLINGLYSLVYIVYYICLGIGGDSFEYWMSDNYRWVSIVGELINAYLVAALVEELCKYYGFRFMEHPDLLFLTGLDRTADQTKSAGGLDSYKYDSQLVSNFSRSCESDGETSIDSRGRRKRKNPRGKNLYEEEEEEPDIRTLQQQAAAITTGMISVAVGLACAENFLYVFFLGGTGGDVSNITMEFAILLFRSIFPVHALSAAMQSINMIRKFIEEKHGGSKNMGVGRIIFPAILLHGTFDAILMCVNAYIEASWDRYYENGGGDDDGNWDVPYNALVVNLVASFGILGVMGLSFGWYTYQNKLQMLRLAVIDMDRSARSGRGRFNAPNLV